MADLTEIIIRKELPTDVDDLAQVNQSALATLRQTYHPNQKALAKRRETAKSPNRLVTVLNNRVVGSVEYRINSDRLHLMSLEVHSDFRRKGVAGSLVEALCQIGKILGATRLTAYTVTQTGNPLIFERMGFRVISEEPSEYFESDRFETLTETLLERLI